MPKLYVCLLADTEDSHPNYVPGWEKYGTDYDKKIVFPRFEWINYWDELLALFKKYNFSVTWFFRADKCINGAALDEFKPFVPKLKDHEIGIHIHTLKFHNNVWGQTTDPVEEARIIRESIALFKKKMGFLPKSSRMGWNAMSNAIMASLQKEGIKYDCSAVPDYYSEGFYNKRDNIIDWRECPRVPYHPSAADYKQKGDMNIVEIPVSTNGKKGFIYNNKVTKIANIIPQSIRNSLLPVAGKMLEKMGCTMHSNFVISSSWNINGALKIVTSPTNKDTLLVGYFHPCEILDTKSGKHNLSYFSKIEELLKHLVKLNYQPMTVSQVVSSMEAE
ncbi:MAG: hypothetical protein ABIJ34_08490 [archaeon]